jgi:RNA polymerase sigma-70 factor (ECF subfamily)
MRNTDRFEEYYQEFWRYVYTVCLSRLGDRERAQDAALDVFVLAYRAFPRYNPALPFKPWICQIAVRHCTDLLRQQLRHAEGMEGLRREAASRPPDHQDPIHLQVSVCLDALGAFDRHLVQMKYLEGYTWEEMEEITDLSVSELRTAVASTVRELRACMTEDVWKKAVQRPQV